MADYYSPPFVTETDEPSPWTDCTWCSGLMLANKATGGKYPATRREREALRVQSGDHFGGSSLYDLNRGLQLRYGWSLVLDTPSWDDLLDRLIRGDGALTQGLYSRLPRHFTRWDRKFAAKKYSAHATYVQGHDRGGNMHLRKNGTLKDVFWNDPLGRSPKNTPADRKYRGEWMPVGVLEDFVTGIAGASNLFVATVRDRELAG